MSYPTRSPEMMRRIRLSQVKTPPIDPDAKLRALIHHLFGAGANGFFFEAREEYNGAPAIYQEIDSKTTPAAPTGDPAGTVVDLSGNGWDLTAGSSSARPTFVNGVLNFDGVSSWLRNDAFSAINQKTVFIALNDYASSIMDGYLAGGSRAFIGDVVYSGRSLAWTLPIGSPLIITVVFNDTDTYARVNGSEVARGNTGDDIMVGISLGADFNGPPLFDKGLHGIALVEGVVDGEELNQAEQYFANLAGVTLP